MSAKFLIWICSMSVTALYFNDATVRNELNADTVLLFGGMMVIAWAVADLKD